MFGIKAKITRCIDDESYPTFVECQFVDAHGFTQTFNDKDAIFTKEFLDRNSDYPVAGIIGCEVIERKFVDNHNIIKVNTELPWGIESIKDETVFEILEEQLIEFEHSPVSVEHDFIPFGDNMVAIDYHLQNLYGAFNKREIETVLSMMDENVKWANGMEGGFVFGRGNVREYWRKQFELINPQLEPFAFKTDAENRQVVTLRQIVRDLDGNLLDDKTVEHIFTIENGLIKVFEIGDFTEPFMENKNFQSLKNNLSKQND
jgi:hypothetical protein